MNNNCILTWGVDSDLVFWNTPTGKKHLYRILDSVARRKEAIAKIQPEIKKAYDSLENPLNEWIKIATHEDIRDLITKLEDIEKDKKENYLPRKQFETEESSID